MARRSLLLARSHLSRRLASAIAPLVPLRLDRQPNLSALAQAQAQTQARALSRDRVPGRMAEPGQWDVV